MKLNDYKLAVIGLGYVGLPILNKFSELYDSVGFDISVKRVNDLKNGIDVTLEIDNPRALKKLRIDSSEEILNGRDIYIITVPTPVKRDNTPDLGPLKLASKMVAKYIKKNSIVIYESTVYPGVTEDVCAEILSRESGLQFNKDFFCGFSPERINPSDKEHTLESIVKVTSGSTPEALRIIDNLYSSIIPAGTFPVDSIKVAEAAKVIENAQRDINIAFMNELSLIFKKLNINMFDVLDAAKTKWNFLDFKPGLVGGHCIGVDPYYLSYIASKVGHKSEIITAGRKLNDEMFNHIGLEILGHLNKKISCTADARILILGVTFKANCPDIRNSKVFNLIDLLSEQCGTVDCFDPHASVEEVNNIYGIKIMQKISQISLNSYDAVIYAVPHDQFKDLSIKKNKNTIIYDFYGISSNYDLSL